MEEIKKETITTQEDNSNPAQENSVKTVVGSSEEGKSNRTQKTQYLIYYLFGALEILLAFRLVLKFMGASHSSGFVSFMYSLTGVFVLPFNGIFHKELAQGVETTSVFEPATLVAIVVYALLAWGIVALIRIFSGEKQDTE